MPLLTAIVPYQIISPHVGTSYTQRMLVLPGREISQLLSKMWRESPKAQFPKATFPR